ncbi:hypothetical protein EPUS_03774 [Endocarpon pusillum Z07020]|uniref:peptidyl-tRNA hydrolase n=1 Tax=Endocarpon pusillum (strain Z07020 / HMAS-L-300199) TaxID=1263415 RepID=U1G9U0_ENDPU|nr:uncharacterized protein EPUS_03774 [Endocarpon pusillum Z07020]ERF68456.1 hypothetical protein EPUS_03774 [Endocarpon pusillum Z07020]
MADSGSPSTATTVVAVGLVAVTVGYFLGQGSNIGLFSISGKTPQPASKMRSWPNSYNVTIHPDSSDEELMAQQRAGAGTQADDNESDEECDGKELKDFSNTAEEVKLVLVVRTDLGMGKGKIAAQCSHATLACYKYLINHAPSAALLQRWERGGQPKIAVQAKSEDDLMTLQAQAVSLGLCTRVIHDAGRTQIAAGSATVLGVLGPKSVVDQVTGQLKLL